MANDESARLPDPENQAHGNNGAPASHPGQNAESSGSPGSPGTSSTPGNPAHSASPESSDNEVIEGELMAEADGEIDPEEAALDRESDAQVSAALGEADPEEAALDRESDAQVAAAMGEVDPEEAALDQQSDAKIAAAEALEQGMPAEEEMVPASEEASAEAEESVDDAWAVAAQTATPAVRPPSTLRKKKKGLDLRELAVPLFVTVGVLLLWPACASLGIFFGWLYPDREGRLVMATIMLTCWPILIILLGCAFWFWHQLRRERLAADKAASIAKAAAQPNSTANSAPSNPKTN